MWLKHLSVLNFKNYTESTVTFLPQVNAFAGENGAGKTNLLDAIHYLALCKSYFNPIDSQHIKKVKIGLWYRASLSAMTFPMLSPVA